MTEQEARDDEREARRVRLDHLLGVYSVGSGEWSWQDEYRQLIDRTVTQRLLADVREVGIKEPILLGTDGRVWDGHHRITVAMHLGIDSVPVEFAGRVDHKHPEPEITDEMVERAAHAYWAAGERDVFGEDFDWDWSEVERDRYLWAARIVLEAALRVPVGEGER